MVLSHFQNVFLVSPQMEQNANDAEKAIMEENVPRNVIVMDMKGNLKHSKDAVIYHNLGYRVGLWCLTPLLKTFQLYRGDRLYWWRKLVFSKMHT